MQISRQCDYAIRIILELGRVYPEISSAKEISEKQKIPQPFLNKIIQELHKARLVETIRGAHGGVKLWMAPDKITLKDVIESVDGPIAFNLCLMGDGMCDNQPTCVVHQVLFRAQEAFVKEIQTVTIAELLT